MPLYEYECDACGKRFEVIQQKFSDPAPEKCARCGKGPVHRQLSSPAIQFKGTGWYITDYAQKGKTDAGAAAAKAEGKSEGKSEATSEATSDTKTETKTETKTDTKSHTKADTKAETKSSS